MRSPHQDAEDLLLPALEAAIVISTQKAGSHITCHAGCSQCCYATFPITQQDVWRLRVGLRLAPTSIAVRIRARAADLRAAQRDDFPGNATTGVLDENPDWQEWFIRRHAGRACPVLDPDTGNCQLYAHRPLACRTYGHLIQIGEQPAPPACHLNFSEIAPEKMVQYHVEMANPLENSEVEHELPAGLTTIAFGLIDDSPQNSRPSI